MNKALPIIFSALFLLTACGAGSGLGNDSKKDDNPVVNTQDSGALDIITKYAKSGGGSVAPSIQNYKDAGVIGITPEKLASMNQIVASLNGEDVDTKVEIQNILNNMSNTIADFDKDGIADKQDNCPASANPDQKDRDNDGKGDVCDLDPDNDSSNNTSIINGITYTHTNQTSSLGINSGRVSDWSRSFAFVDIFKQTRKFSEDVIKGGHEIVDGNPKWVTTIKKPGITFDKNGYPIDLNSHELTTYLYADGKKGTVPSGHYTVLYDGEAKLSYGSATLVSSEPGKDVIDIQLPDTGKGINVSFNIKSTNPDNHIRNIRVLMPGGICANDPYNHVANAQDCNNSTTYLSFVDHHKDIVFNPDFLRFLKDFDTLRLLNFMGVIDNVNKEWSDRPKVTDAQWSRQYLRNMTGDLSEYGVGIEGVGSDKWNRVQLHGTLGGVPLEVAVDLVNRLNINPWFNIPHRSSDDYNRQFATYVKEHLNPNLKSYIEYSNEIWGTGLFIHGHYAGWKGYERFGDGKDDTHRNWSGYIEFIARRPTEIFDVWESVFGGTGKITRVLGAQAGYAKKIDDMLNKYPGVPEKVDAIAIGFYFLFGNEGQIFGTPDGEGKNCLGQNGTKYKFDPNITKSYVMEHMSDFVDKGFANLDTSENMLDKTRQLTDHKAIADPHGIKLIAYEGGQHLNHWSCFNNPATGDAIHEVFHAMNRDPRMGAVYNKFLDVWKDNGGDLFNLYSMPGKWGKSGSWGIMESLNGPYLPKYQSLKDFMKETPRWWE